jgi:hypothetical protein
VTPTRLVDALVLSGGLLIAGCGARSTLQAEAGAAAGGVTSGAGGATTSGGQGGGGEASGGQGGGEATGEGGSSSDCVPPSTRIPITLNAVTPTKGTLLDSCFDAHVYSFCGKKGDILYVQTRAQPPSDGFDPTYLDTLVGVSLSAGGWSAQNDTPATGDTQDAQLFTVLPSDGDYLLRVEGAGAMVDGDGLTLCELGGWVEPTNHDYTVAAFKIPVSPIKAPDFTFDEEPDDTLASARPIAYAKETTSQSYSISRIAGRFDAITDVDVYSFTIPTDAAIVDPMQTRPVGHFYLPYVAHDRGDGSTAQIGSIWIVDAMDPARRVASLEPAEDPSFSLIGHELAPPLVFGHPYYLFVSRPAGATAGTNDFYFISHRGKSSSPIEKADLTALKNDTPAHAEPLTGAKEPGSLVVYDVDGDIAPAQDVDFYALAVPAGATSVVVACGAERLGSSLRDLSVALFEPDGTTLLAEPGGEQVWQDAYAVAPLSGGVATVLLEIKAAWQDPGVSSTFYRCHAFMR